MIRIRSLDDGDRYVIARYGLAGLAADLEVRRNRPLQGTIHPFAPEIADDVPKPQVLVPIGPRPTGGRRAVVNGYVRPRIFGEQDLVRMGGPASAVAVSTQEIFFEDRR